MTITRKHDKTKEEVRSSAEKIAKEMQSTLGISYEWAGDTLTFSGTGVKGNIEIEDKLVAVTVKKSFFVPMSEASIREKVNEYLDKYIS